MQKYVCGASFIGARENKGTASTAKSIYGAKKAFRIEYKSFIFGVGSRKSL